MASYTTHTLASGIKVIKAHVRISGNTPISRSFKSRSEAEIWAEKEEGLMLEDARKNRTLAFQSFHREKFKYAIDQYAARAHTAQIYIPVLKVIRENIGDLTFGDLRPSKIAAYIEKMMKTKTRMGRFYKGNTMATHLSVMSTVFKWRALEYDIDVKPTVFSRSLIPKGYDEKRIRRLSLAEERLLFEELRKRKRSGYLWRLLVKLALETGARQQELFLAQWSDFDLKRKVWDIPIENTKCSVARSVPLSKAARRVIKCLMKLSPEMDSRPFSGLISCVNIRSTWRNITAAAGIKNFRFHDLRHEAISRLVLYKRKLTVFEIMKFVGHSSTIMLSRYANLRGDEMADRID